MDLDEAMLRNYAGWHVPDDDTPRPPEVEPLASGQRKRYLREAVRHTPGRDGTSDLQTHRQRPAR